jgi:hypothetical protein
MFSVMLRSTSYSQQATVKSVFSSKVEASVVMMMSGIIRPFEE